MLKKNSNGKIIESSGLVFEVLDQISHKLNFSYSVREPADGKWGAMEVEMNICHLEFFLNVIYPIILN